MSLAAVGAYINLLATAWDSDPVASLPNDENRLWRLAGAVDRAEWDEISAEVMSNFEPEGKRLVNRRLQEVFENMLRHSDAQRDRVSKRYRTGSTAPLPGSKTAVPTQSYSSTAIDTATATSIETAKVSINRPITNSDDSNTETAIKLTRYFHNLVSQNPEASIPPNWEELWFSDMEALLATYCPDDAALIIEASQKPNWRKYNRTGRSLIKNAEKIAVQHGFSKLPAETETHELKNFDPVEDE